MEEIDEINFSSLTSTQALSRRARELEVEEFHLKRDFTELVKNREKEISDSAEQVDLIINDLEKLNVVVKNAKRQNRSTVECGFSLLKLFQLKRRLARLQNLAELLEPLETMSTQLAMWDRKDTSLSDQLGLLNLIVEKAKNFPACKADLGKEVKRRAEKFIQRFQESLQQIIMNSDLPFNKAEILDISNRLQEMFRCPKFPRLLITEFCTCVDKVARNSSIAVSDEANATTVILSLCEFISVLASRLQTLKTVFDITDHQVDQLFGEKVTREIIKFLTVHRFSLDEERQASEIFAHIVDLDAQHPDHQLLHHCLEPFSDFIEKRLARVQPFLSDLVPELLESNASLRRLQTEFPFFQEQVEGKRELVLRRSSTAVLSWLDLTLPEVDASDIYDVQERRILTRRFPNLTLTGVGSRKKRSREKLASDRLAVLEVFEKDGNMDFRELREFMFERTVYDLISESLATWSTSAISAQSDQSLAQVTNKFIAESEKTLSGLNASKDVHSKLLKARSRELANQALEALGLVQNNKHLNLSGLISMISARLGDCEVWTTVREFEAVLKKDALTLAEAMAWAKRQETIPLRLLAVLISKRLDNDDAAVHRAYEELEAFFSEFY